MMGVCDCGQEPCVGANVSALKPNFGPGWLLALTMFLNMFPRRQNTSTFLAQLLRESQMTISCVTWVSDSQRALSCGQEIAQWVKCLLPSMGPEFSSPPAAHSWEWQLMHQSPCLGRGRERKGMELIGQSL